MRSCVRITRLALQRMRSAVACVWAACMLLWGTGCAPIQSVTPVSTRPARPAPQPVAADTSAIPVPPPGPGVAVGSTASGGSITAHGANPAVVDSGPSREALDVLASIPDPLPASQRVAPPESVQQRMAALASGAAFTANDAPRIAQADTGAAPADTGAAAAADTLAPDGGGIPTPEPTVPLGQRRTRTVPVVPDSVLQGARPDSAVLDSAGRAAAARRDSLARRARAAGDSLPALPAGGAQAVHPDSCWRVQVAAPVESERADALRRAAESLLLMPMVVEEEQALFKVRTRDCVDGETATRLKDRAQTSGFEGAFRFRRR